MRCARSTKHAESAARERPHSALAKKPPSAKAGLRVSGREEVRICPPTPPMYSMPKDPGNARLRHPRGDADRLLSPCLGSRRVGADRGLSHFAGVCRRPCAPGSPPENPHASWARGLIRWLNRLSAPWLNPPLAPTCLRVESRPAHEREPIWNGCAQERLGPAEEVFERSTPAALPEKPKMRLKPTLVAPSHLALTAATPA